MSSTVVYSGQPQSVDVAPGEAVLVAVQVGDAWTTTGIAISASLSVEARS